MRSGRLSCVVLASLSLLACDRRKPSATTTMTLTASDADISAKAPDASTAAAPGACAAEPPRGVPIPASARATDVRLAVAAGRALVTWWETTKRGEGPDLDAAYAHVFDGAIGPRITVATADIGDEFTSAAVPLSDGGALSLVTCWYGAPSGQYSCSRGAPGAKASPIFAFSGIAFGGPAKSPLAAVAKGSETVVFAPDPSGRDVLLFSSRVSSLRKAYEFGTPKDGPFADGMSAVLTGTGSEEEATVVFRSAGAVRARRATFAQTWRSPAVELGTKGAQVGVPVAAADGARVVALFSERAKASDPWSVRWASLAQTGEVLATRLPTGNAQAQGPALARTMGGCFLASWVEGEGKATRTEVARVCDGRGAPELVAGSRATLSAPGVEGGRATLATDPSAPGAAFVVWQELPAGKPAELRIAKLACR